MLDIIREIDDDEFIVQLSSRFIEAIDAVDIYNITKDITFGRCSKDPFQAEPLLSPYKLSKPKPRASRFNQRKLFANVRKKAHKRSDNKYIVRYAFNVDVIIGEAS